MTSQLRDPQLDFHEIQTHLSDIPNFISIRHNKAEIQRREFKRELWRKIGYYVTVILTFDPRSPISIGFELVQ